MANLFKVLKSFFLHKYHQWKIMFPGYSAPRGPYGRCLDCVPLSDWRVTSCSNDLQHHRPLQAVHQVSLYVFKMWMSGNSFCSRMQSYKPIIKFYLFFQWIGLPQWEEQVTRDRITSSGVGHPLSSGSHLLLSPTWGGTGTRRETDQAPLSPQPAEPLPGGGNQHAAIQTSCSMSARNNFSVIFRIKGNIIFYSK